MTLKEIRAEITAYHERPHGLEDSDRMRRLVVRVEALDDWLASGGFKPRRWRPDGSVTGQ